MHRPGSRRRSYGWATLAAVAALAMAASPAVGAPGDGLITTVAAVPYQPRGMAPEASGAILVVEFSGDRLLRVAANGSLSTIAGTGVAGYGGDGGPAVAAQLNGPTDVIVVGSGPYQGILVADEFNHRVRHIDAAGIITTVAGTGLPGNSGHGGPATLAELRNPRALSATPGGGFLIADEFNNQIRQVAADGTITIVAGADTGAAGLSGDGGAPTSALLFRPLGVTSVGAGHFLIADGYNNCVREVKDGKIRTVAGSCGNAGFAGDGGQARNALLKRPRDVVRSSDGGLYIADSLNNRVRRIAPDGVISTVAGTGSPAPTGDGPAVEAALNQPSNLLIEPDGVLHDLLIADTENWQLRRVQHPLPAIGALSPNSAPADGASIALTVTGTGFASSAVVLWKGVPRPTTWTDSTHLRATLSAADLASPGTATVAVRSGVQGGDATLKKTFTIGPRTPGLPRPVVPLPPVPSRGETPNTPPTAPSTPISVGLPVPGTTDGVLEPLRLTLSAPARVRIRPGASFVVVVRLSRPVTGGRVALQRLVGRQFHQWVARSARGRTVRMVVRARRTPGQMRVRAVATSDGERVASPKIVVRVVR